MMTQQVSLLLLEVEQFQTLLSTASVSDIENLYRFLYERGAPSRQLPPGLIQGFLPSQCGNPDWGSREGTAHEFGSRQYEFLFPRNKEVALSSPDVELLHNDDVFHRLNAQRIDALIGHQRPCLLERFLQSRMFEDHKCVLLHQVFHFVDWTVEDNSFRQTFFMLLWTNVVEKNILRPHLGALYRGVVATGRTAKDIKDEDETNLAAGETRASTSVIGSLGSFETTAAPETEESSEITRAMPSSVTLLRRLLDFVIHKGVIAVHFRGAWGFQGVGLQILEQVKATQIRTVYIATDNTRFAHFRQLVDMLRNEYQLTVMSSEISDEINKLEKQEAAHQRNVRKDDNIETNGEKSKNSYVDQNKVVPQFDNSDFSRSDGEASLGTGAMKVSEAAADLFVADEKPQRTTDAAKPESTTTVVDEEAEFFGDTARREIAAEDQVFNTAIPWQKHHLEASRGKLPNLALYIDLCVCSLARVFVGQPLSSLSELIVNFRAVLRKTYGNHPEGAKFEASIVEDELHPMRSQKWRDFLKQRFELKNRGSGKINHDILVALYEKVFSFASGGHLLRQDKDSSTEAASTLTASRGELFLRAAPEILPAKEIYPLNFYSADEMVSGKWLRNLIQALQIAGATTTSGTEQKESEGSDDDDPTLVFRDPPPCEIRDPIPRKFDMRLANFWTIQNAQTGEQYKREKVRIIPLLQSPRLNVTEDGDLTSMNQMQLRDEHLQDEAPLDPYSFDLARDWSGATVFAATFFVDLGRRKCHSIGLMKRLRFVLLFLLLGNYLREECVRELGIFGYLTYLEIYNQGLGVWRFLRKFVVSPSPRIQLEWVSLLNLLRMFLRTTRCRGQYLKTFSNRASEDDDYLHAFYRPEAPFFKKSPIRQKLLLEEHVQREHLDGRAIYLAPGVDLRRKRLGGKPEGAASSEQVVECLPRDAASGVTPSTRHHNINVPSYFHGPTPLDLQVFFPGGGVVPDPLRRQQHWALGEHDPSWGPVNGVRDMFGGPVRDFRPGEFCSSENHGREGEEYKHLTIIREKAEREALDKVSESTSTRTTTSSKEAVDYLQNMLETLQACGVVRSFGSSAGSKTTSRQLDYFEVDLDFLRVQRLFGVIIDEDETVVAPEGDGDQDESLQISTMRIKRLFDLQKEQQRGASTLANWCRQTVHHVVDERLFGLHFSDSSEQQEQGKNTPTPPTAATGYSYKVASVSRRGTSTGAVEVDSLKQLRVRTVQVPSLTPQQSREKGRPLDALDVALAHALQMLTLACFQHPLIQLNAEGYVRFLELWNENSFTQHGATTARSIECPAENA
ncbi:unnamed protein product [Amoebophrya sp. A25]|nr:unnamed protein product [Amoebophrya sp. A25]|eukprot:GSA25T00026083001.1